jgi:hypothetical protein
MDVTAFSLSSWLSCVLQDPQVLAAVAELQSLKEAAAQVTALLHAYVPEAAPDLSPSPFTVLAGLDR